MTVPPIFRALHRVRRLFFHPALPGHAVANTVNGKLDALELPQNDRSNTTGITIRAARRRINFLIRTAVADIKVHLSGAPDGRIYFGTTIYRDAFCRAIGKVTDH